MKRKLRSLSFKVLVLLVALCCLLTGCKPDHRTRLAYASCTINGQKVTYVAEYTHFDEKEYDGLVEPLFLIMWKGTSETVEINGAEPSIRIEGHLVKVSFEIPGVYVLRKDYSLETIKVTDRVKLFASLKTNSLTTTEPVWTQQILPKLQTIP